MTDAIVDACCFINLYATGDLRGFLTALPWSWHVPRVVLAESLYIRVVNDKREERRETIEPQRYVDDGLIDLVDVENADEIELYVQLAGDLDDGEAMALAIASQRHWTLATDDRKAMRFAAGLGVPVVTTPELIWAWAAAAKMPPTAIKSLLRRVEFRARFVPAPDVRGDQWWMEHNAYCG